MKNKNIFFQTSVAHIFTFAKAEWQATMKMYYFSFLLRFFFQSWEFCCFPSTFSPHGNSVAQTRPASGRNTKFHLNWSCVKRWAGQPTDVRIPRAAPLVLARNRSHVITPIFFFFFFTPREAKLPAALLQSQLGDSTPPGNFLVDVHGYHFLFFVFSRSLLIFFLLVYSILLFRDGWLRRENQILTLRDATDSPYLHIAGPQNESGKNRLSVGSTSCLPPRFSLPIWSSKLRASVGEKRALEKALPQSPAKSHCLLINLEFTPPHSDIPFEN